MFGLHKGGTTLAVTVVPRAARTEVRGVVDGCLRVAVRASPVDGVANAELIRFFGKLSGVPKGRIRIIQGARSRRKTVLFDGVLEAELLPLSRWLTPAPAGEGGQ